MSVAIALFESEVESVAGGDSFLTTGVETVGRGLTMEGLRTTCSYGNCCRRDDGSLSETILVGFNLDPLDPPVGGDTLDDEMAVDIVGRGWLRDSSGCGGF